ncbi:amidohydrolase [Cupriavidus necator]|uniref:Amidohydrolase n=1 Tax=Cupriavidus necator TaxID=106590 RepID=A0A1U9UXY8_CUPNE|nr:amidohydrolase family protein [Cupriavidus necator]AQV97576.1 amidohydrolase [Cupriavidus necator]
MAALRIDAHTHFWRYQPEAYPWIGPDLQALAADHMPDDLLPHLRTHGMDAAIAVQARAGTGETRFLLELADRHPWIAAVVGWEDLRAPDFAQRLQRWAAAPKLRGFRHQVQDEADASQYLGLDAVTDAMGQLQSLGYAYDVLVFNHQLEAAARFCARHDRHWLVLDHLGKPPLAGAAHGSSALAAWRAALRRLRPLPHVVCKLSGLVTETDWRAGLQAADMTSIDACLDVALDVFGPARLMFGSDWPVCTLAAPYGGVYGIVRRWADLRLSAEEQYAFWGGTAALCYGLQTT